VCSEVLSPTVIGAIAAILDTASYTTSVDTIKETLQTKNISIINLVMALISGFNSVSWIIYSLLLDDFYILIPSTANILVVAVHICLFLWTVDKIESSNWLIRLLHRHCRGKVHVEVLTRKRQK